MSKKVMLLNYADHGHLKIKPTNTFDHVNTQQVLPLIVHELSTAAAEMPVVFVKNTETGEFQPVGVMGFKPSENLFYHKEKWRGTYVPAYATHHPFALVPSSQNENQLQIAITEESVLVSETEGDAMFDEQGNETEYLAKRKKALGSYYENMHITKAFTQALVDNLLLVEQSLSIDFNGEKITINGLYLVNEKKLNALSDDVFLFLRKKGFLAPIYSHMGSLHQLKQLAKLKSST